MHDGGDTSLGSSSHVCTICLHVEWLSISTRCAINGFRDGCHRKCCHVHMTCPRHGHTPDLFQPCLLLSLSPRLGISGPCAWCRHTRGRSEKEEGVLNLRTGVFSVPHHTTHTTSRHIHTHTHHIHHTHTPHNTTPHNHHTTDTTHTTRFEQVCVAFCVSFVGRTHAGGPWLLATELTAAPGVPAVAESDDCARG